MDICEGGLLLKLIWYKTKKLKFPKGKSFIQDHRLGIKISLSETQCDSVRTLHPAPVQEWHVSVLNLHYRFYMTVMMVSTAGHVS